MSNFRVNKPISCIESTDKKDVNKFAKGAETHSINVEEFEIDAKPNRSFTVPMNDYELNLLKQIAKKEDRSQRYMARKLMLEAMKQELDIN
jgi:hypothetical protein